MLLYLLDTTSNVYLSRGLVLDNKIAAWQKAHFWGINKLKHKLKNRKNQQGDKSQKIPDKKGVKRNKKVKKEEKS